jgi:hypothetical protein
MRLRMVMAVARDMFAAALGTADALRPTRLTHKFETFRVIEQRRQIDQNARGSNLPESVESHMDSGKSVAGK